MLRNRFLSLAIVGLSLAGCSKEDDAKEKRLAADNAALQQQVNALQAEVDTLGPQGAGLKEIQNKLEETRLELEAARGKEEGLTQEKAALEKSIADLQANSSGSAAKLLELNKKLRDKEAQLKSEQEKSKSLADAQAYFDALIKKTLDPFWGLYISQGAPFAVGASSCRLLVYGENNGQITRALVCQDGKLQWEKQQMKSFDAVVDDRLEGKYGFGIHAETQSSSCNRRPSGQKGSGDYHFERASTYGEAQFSVGLQTQQGNGVLRLSNAAVDYTSNECEDIIARADRPGQLSADQLDALQVAGKFCRFLRGEKPFLVGCFAEGNTFVPFF